MAQDVNIGREILPIPDQPYRGPVPFDARTAEAPKATDSARTRRCAECSDRPGGRYGLWHSERLWRLREHAHVAMARQ